MSTETTIEQSSSEELIDRVETGIRALLVLLFFVIARVAEAVLGVVIVFGLLDSLITRQVPSPALKRFAQRTLSYLVQIVNYMTYNDDDAPFPFQEFPPELE